MKNARKIINIDEEKCTGCGLCVSACAEGALQIIDGKAKLVSEVFCDGLGACLGECPEGALTIEERPAADFDEKAVEQFLHKQKAPAPPPHAPMAHSGGCPGSALRSFQPKTPAETPHAAAPSGSALSHWPVQLMLVPPSAPFLKGADLLICADCVPFTVPDFHMRYLRGRAVLVACPKLDDLDYYRAKLKDIIEAAQPSRLTVLRMEVPCCGGLAHAVKKARDQISPSTPLEVHTLGIRGGVRQEYL